MWSAFSLVLLGKMLLNAHLHHYGFALTMPATLLLVVCLVWLGTAALRWWWGGGDVFRRLVVAALAADMLFSLRNSHHYYSLKNDPIAKGGDQIFVYDSRPDPDQPAGPDLKRLLQFVETSVPGDA